MTAPSDVTANGPLESAEHDAIGISKAPAVVSWTGEDDQPRCLSHSPSNHNCVTLDIHFDAKSHITSFKITANIAFRGKRNKSNTFLLIYPERIQSLAVIVDGNDVSTSASERLGTRTYSLRFTLTTPCALVLPKDGFSPKDDLARSTLEAFQALARQTSFQVDFPCEVLPKSRLIALCDKASSSGCLKSMPGSENLAKLYGGNGGRVVEYGKAAVNEVLPTEEVETTQAATQGPHDEGQGDTQELNTQPHNAVESPPSYNELGPGHSPPSRPPPPKKRRRLDSEAIAGDASQSKTRLEDICRQGFGEIGLRLDRIEQRLDDLGSRLGRVERRICMEDGQHDVPGGPNSGEQEHRQRDELEQRVDGLEGRVASVEEKLEAGLSELADTIDDQMAEAKNDLEQTVLVCVEDEMGIAQSQFEDFVRNEIRDVGDDIEEIVKERLRDALS